MSTQPLVLVADDEPHRKLVAIALSEEGFRVVTANGGEQALQKAEEVRRTSSSWTSSCPTSTGSRSCASCASAGPSRSSCSRRRARPPTRPRASTSARTTTSPSRSTRTSWRRACARSSVFRWAEPGAGVIKFDDVEIDLEQRMVTRNGELVQLSLTEWLLLKASRRERRQVVLHTELLTKVWGPEYRDDLQYLRVWVSRVRRKLGALPGEPGRSGRSWASATCSMSRAPPPPAGRGGRRGARTETAALIG